MSIQFFPGDIVRRSGGWTPMRVVRATSYDVELVYCPGNLSTPEVYSNDEIKKVTDPVKEFARSPGWESRLTEQDKIALSRQRHVTAESLPWQYQNKAKETTMTKLYQTKEATPRFGTLLATNSAGLLVMEMKGTGEVLTFAKNDVEEVKPYTVRIKFQDSHTEYEYLSRKGDVEKGDMVILNGNGHIAKVVAVDTKSDKATKDLVGRKVMTTPFGEAVAE
jgi:hypothetical protein